jgi:hypothetical protein
MCIADISRIECGGYLFFYNSIQIQCHLLNGTIIFTIPSWSKPFKIWFRHTRQNRFPIFLCFSFMKREPYCFVLNLRLLISRRDVRGEWARWAIAHFCRLGNPVSTRGDRLCRSLAQLTFGSFLRPCMLLPFRAKLGTYFASYF